jgi:hypothetical protein
MVMSRYRPAIPRYAVTPNSVRSMRVLARALNHRALAAVHILRTERDERVPLSVEEALRTDPVVSLPVPGAEARGIDLHEGTRAAHRHRSSRPGSRSGREPARTGDRLCLGCTDRDAGGAGPGLVEPGLVEPESGHSILRRVACGCVLGTLGSQPAPDVTRKVTCQVESSRGHRAPGTEVPITPRRPLPAAPIRSCPAHIPRPRTRRPRWDTARADGRSAPASGPPSPSPAARPG